MSLRALLSVGLLASLLTGLPLAAEQDLAGLWLGHGERERSIVEVEVTFTRTSSGYEGSFSSEQLRVVGIPFTEIGYVAPRLTWELVGDFIYILASTCLISYQEALR